MASRVGAPVNVTFGASFTVPSGANAFIASGIWYDGANQAVTAVSGSRITVDNVAAVPSSGSMGVYSVRGRVNSTGSDTWSITKAGFFSEGPTCQVQFYSVADNTNFVRQQQVVGDTSGAITRAVNSTTSDLVDAWIMSDGGGTVSGAISGFTAVGTEQTVNADKSRVFQANSPGASTTSITGPANSFPGLVIASVYDSSASPTNYTLTCDVGAYTLTGIAAALRRGYTIAANTGSYGITGQAATTKRGYSLVADVGGYSLSGQDAALRRGYSAALDTGAYSLTGYDATLTYSAGSTAYSLTCDVGSYSLMGQDATLVYTPGSANYTLACDTGSYSLTGVSATTSFGRRLNLDAGAYTLTGQSATTSLGRRLIADAGAYSLTGHDATLTATVAVAYSLLCESGSYDISGGEATLRWSGEAQRSGGGSPRRKGYIIKGQRYWLTDDELSVLLAQMLTEVKRTDVRRDTKKPKVLSHGTWARLQESMKALEAISTPEPVDDEDDEEALLLLM